MNVSNENPEVVKVYTMYTLTTFWRVSRGDQIFVLIKNLGWSTSLDFSLVDVEVVKVYIVYTLTTFGRDTSPNR